MRLRWIVSSFFLLLAAAAPAFAGSVRIAVVQLNAADVGDFNKMLADARSAKAAGAQLVVFPETADMGWLNPKAFSDSAEIPGAVTDRFADIARATGIWVVTGLAERGEQIAAQPPTFEAYDSAVLIDPTGIIVLHHRQFNVLKNAFSSCPAAFGARACGYTPG
jgi:N-carbamoylputrescine amidase